MPADQEFLVSYGVKIDEAGVSRLQQILEQDRIDGLDVGADAYLTKPFNIEVLKKTVANLLKSRSRLKVTYSEPKVKDSDIKEVGIKTPDDRLMERVLRVINERLDDPKLTVDAVAYEVGLSRVHLYRKIKELTNMAPNEFIKNLRLKKAAEMLSTAKYSIAELADAVGFSSSTYFATAFKDLYGMTPSEYRLSTLPTPIRKSPGRPGASEDTSGARL